MIIKPARADETSLEDFSLATLPVAWNGTLLLFPSYFRSLTPFPSQMSPRYLGRNYATQKFLNLPISLSPGELRVV